LRNITKTSYFEAQDRSRLLILIFLKSSSLVFFYDKQQVCTCLQPFLLWIAIPGFRLQGSQNPGPFRQFQILRLAAF